MSRRAAQKKQQAAEQEVQNMQASLNKFSRPGTSLFWFSPSAFKEVDVEANLHVAPLLVHENDKIGEGSNGAVFMVHWPSDDSRVALKKLPNGVVQPENIKQLLQEIAVLQRINGKSPHIIQVLGYAFFPPAFVLEYAEYKSVWDCVINPVIKLRAKEPGRTFTVLSSSAAHFVLLQVAKGMNYLATEEIVHRDLKCLNVLVFASGCVKIADFGVSCPMTGHSTMAMFTVTHMAPELLEERHVFSQKTDVYSFGVSAIELLKCNYPYGHAVIGNSPVEIIAKVKGLVPGLLSNLAVEDGASADEKELRKIVHCCARVAPQDERPTFANVVERLEKLSFCPNQGRKDLLEFIKEHV